MERLLGTLSNDADDAEKFELIVRVFYTEAGKSPQLNRLVTDESAFDSDRLDYLHDEYTGPFLGQIEPIVQRLMDAGRIPKVPMDVLFSALTGPVLVPTQEQIARRVGRAEHLSAEDWERRTRSLAELVLQGLLPARVPSAPPVS
jgi:hypothetical protein